MIRLWKWIRVATWFLWNRFDIQGKEKECAEKLLSLGTIGIKLGQYLCNRPHLCSHPLKEHLLPFLSHNPTHSEAYTTSVLQRYRIKATLGNIIGSGSVAQVYECFIKGKRFALKINHPLEDFQADIFLFRWLLWFLAFMIPVVHHVDWKSWLDSLEQQTDMRIEAQTMKQYRHIYKSFPAIRIPSCIRYERDFILMSFEEGIPLYELKRTDLRYIQAHLLVMASFLHTGFVHHIMHGDVHEGNILVGAQGIILLDFGICFRLNMSQLTLLLSNPHPKKKDMAQLLSVLLVNDKKDKSALATALTKEYRRLFLGHHVPSFHDLFETISLLVEQHDFVLKSSMVTYMMNLMLLEDMSPFESCFDQMSTVLAIQMMKTIPFFRKECGSKMDGYFTMLLKHIS
jgi:predicted unusual protein kinase regulating ubiquinone biosynthesis (AarF/ABC1/UbiB family)